jgi:integrase
MYEQKIAQLARVFGERRPLSTFTSETVDQFIDKRLAEGVTQHTVHKELAVLRQILKHCKRRGWFRQEIEQVMPVGFSPNYVPKKEFLPVEYWDLLLDGGWVGAHDGISKHDAFVEWSADRKKVKVEPMRADRAAHVAFMLATGANLEESFRAMPEHIDVTNRRVFIDGTKRETRKRFVPINKLNVKLIKRVLLDAPGKRVGQPLFAEWGKMWRDLGDRCRKLGLPRLSSNDLRRTYGSILVQAGVPFEIVAKLMGHASVAMVFKVYGQLRPTHVQEMVAQYIPEAK